MFSRITGKRIFGVAVTAILVLIAGFTLIQLAKPVAADQEHSYRGVGHIDEGDEPLGYKDNDTTSRRAPASSLVLQIGSLPSFLQL